MDKLDKIIEIALDMNQVTLNDVISANTDIYVTNARMLICYFALENGYTLLSISERVGLNLTRIWSNSHNLIKKSKKDITLKHIIKEFKEHLNESKE